MAGPTRILRVGDGGPSSPAVAEAAALVASGALVAFPTETVYGIGANAADPAAVERLRVLKNRPDKPFSIHIAEVADLRKHVSRVPALGQKLVKKFWPGPLTIVFGKNEDAVGVRLPAHEVAVAFIRAAGVSVFAPSANRAGEPPASTAQAALEALDGQIDAVLDGGPAPLAQSSSVVRVWRNGWELLREGIITRSMIERALKMHVIFICTGNSCRSPIAEKVCREIMARRFDVPEARLPELGYTIESAGTAAAGGGGPSQSALAAARDVGLDISGHRTRELTAAMLRSADKVYAMSESHVAAARGLCPEAAARIELLDPQGRSIEDPIGYPIEQFSQVIWRIRKCVERRVEDL